ncbi:ABC transporter permease [Granulosicoccus sp.]|nr:ABC transporter permease [Granulosicoccus sp.]MDB4223094.1 ABC transporter permease [Granulosicoccus sp.]
MSSVGLRGFVIGALFIGLIIALIACWIYGRRLIKSEKTDAVFGNPVKALGGWHWVVSGVATIILVWLYFSWDAARAFFPNAANELCQVAKVNNAIHPMRSVFPFESRLLKGTVILDRENGQIERITDLLNGDDYSDKDREQLGPFLERSRILLASMSNVGSLDATTNQSIAEVASRIDVLTEVLKAGKLPDGADTAIIQARENQPGWGDSSQEVPVDPTSPKGALFSSVAAPMAEISKDFGKIRNTSAEFLSEVDAINTDVKAIGEQSESPAVQAFAKDMNKLLKRIDNGAVFPPGSLNSIETALAEFHEVQLEKQGSLTWIDAIAMPSGTIMAGNTACSEQGSGRWLPKPSDTFATLARLSDPEVGYKGFPLLWYKQKPVAEMVGFILPDFLADLVPGAYPRHSDDGTISRNLKTKVLDIVTGNFESPSIPVPTGHIWDSIIRVLAGLFLGILLGVPLGLFMGLSRFAKGFFDPMIELYRPVPPLAWAPLILTIFGIHDDGKIFLLFMVAFAIMVISARTGATGTQLSKIHAAHSLGASRWQIVRSVILPNSLPEILTGIRIAIGVCWGTLVAAEMLAGTTGIGFVENVARKQSDYEIIWVTIILLGSLGLLFDMIMRVVINKTIPWRGKG